MVIDFHTHVFPDQMAGKAIGDLEVRSGVRASFDGTRDGLLRSMDEAGVDLSVIQPVVTSPRQFSGINRFAAQTNELYDGRLLSFGGIHPDSPDYRADLRTLKGWGFCGIKLHPDYQGVFFNDIRYKRIVSYAMELGLVVLVHAGVDIGLPEVVHCTPAMAREVSEETEADRLVLAHYGGWKLWEEVEARLVGTSCYLDTAFLDPYLAPEQFLRILRHHGADRVLFATDAPWSCQRGTIEWIRGFGLSNEEENAIFYQNAARLLSKAAAR